MNTYLLNTCKLFFIVFLLTGCKDKNEQPPTTPIVEENLLVIETPCFLDKTSPTVIAQADGNFEAYKTTKAITIDGCAKENIWINSNWYSLNYKWMGNAPDTSDYNGRFKLTWDSLHLYILVEVTDEFLNETLADGQENYWKGDYVEVFVDEDQSGGDHKFNHQAFAYHVSTEGHAIDKNTKEKTVFFDSHVNVVRSKQGNRHLWEMSVLLFDQNFDENATNNVAVKIMEGKKIGFSLAYGDNDGNKTRENFMGSKATHGINNDEGYINSDVFGSIIFLN